MIKNLVIALFCLSFTSVAQAVLKIDITEGFEGALPIAVIPFQWNGANKTPDGDVSAIIMSDLARSGKFSPVAEKDLVERLGDDTERIHTILNQLEDENFIILYNGMVSIDEQNNV